MGKQGGVMNCPRDNRPLKEIDINGILVDICEECGGVWFDNQELKKFDEQHEKTGDKLSELMSKYQKGNIDFSQRLKSPKQPDVIMLRHFYSPAKQVTIDVCPATGGIWLDAGELAKMREMYPTEADRQKAGDELVKNVFNSPEFIKASENNEANLKKARDIAHVFRFICPSYYIPGKQDGGAF
jgi:Zn-finger nucleic acid-binding protein